MNNLREIKLMLPDYINGRLSETESEIVKNAISQSEDLKILYNDMKQAGELITSVTFPEPGDLYWSGLLPEIHRKIENQKTKLPNRIGNILSFPYYAYAAAAAILFIISIWQWNNIYKFILPEKSTGISEIDPAKHHYDNNQITQNITDTIPQTKEYYPENNNIQNKVRNKTGKHHKIETIDEIIPEDDEVDFLSDYNEEDIFEELNDLSAEEEIKLLETLKNNL